MSQMTVCQTCGDKGYSNLLIFCVQCQIVAVHRYCVDGPSTIDDDEITWYCEDCVPRMAKPAAPCRKSQRRSTKIEQEAFRTRAQRRKRSNSSLLEAEKPNLVRESVPKVTTNTSDLNNKCNDGILESQQGELQENSTLQLPQVPDDHDSQQGELQENKSCDADALTIQKRGMYTNKIVKRMRTKAVVLTRQKDGDLSSNADGEGQPVKLEKKSDGDGIQGSTCESYKKSDGNSIPEKEHKHGHCFNGTQFRPLEELPGTSSSLAYKESEVVEGEIVDFLDERGEDTLSSCAVSECQSPRKKKRRLVIEVEYSDGEQVNALAEPSPANPSDVGDIFRTSKGKLPAKLDDHASPAKPDDHIPTLTSLIKLAKHVLSQPPPTEFNNHVRGRPIIDAIWRGCCGINNSIDPMSFELEAHLSNKAFAIVHDAANALPKLIDFEIVPKRYAWPKKYEKSPPKGDDIGLYFFPVGERDERLYENLLDKMIDRHLILMSRINNLELLIFCSKELPEHEWRFQNKYYLWGTFRPKQEAMEPSKPSPTQITKSWLSSPADSPGDEGYQKQKYYHANDHKALNYFPKAALPDNLKHPKPIYNTRTYNSRLGKDKHRGRNYQQSKVRYHGNREHDSIRIKPVQKGSYCAKERYRPNRACDSVWVRPRHENCDD